jgi:hypothetical protein
MNSLKLLCVLAVAIRLTLLSSNVTAEWKEYDTAYNTARAEDTELMALCQEMLKIPSPLTADQVDEFNEISACAHRSRLAAIDKLLGFEYDKGIVKGNSIGSQACDYRMRNYR